MKEIFERNEAIGFEGQMLFYAISFKNTQNVYQSFPDRCLFVPFHLFKIQIKTTSFIIGGKTRKVILLSVQLMLPMTVTRITDFVIGDGLK